MTRRIPKWMLLATAMATAGVLAVPARADFGYGIGPCTHHAQQQSDSSAASAYGYGYVPYYGAEVGGYTYISGDYYPTGTLLYQAPGDYYSPPAVVTYYNQSFVPFSFRPFAPARPLSNR